MTYLRSKQRCFISVSVLSKSSLMALLGDMAVLVRRRKAQRFRRSYGYLFQFDASELHHAAERLNIPT